MDLRTCDVKIIKKEGGDNGLAVGGVQDDEPVVVSGIRGIKYPITARMLATQAHLRRLYEASLRVDLQICIVVLIVRMTRRLRIARVRILSFLKVLSHPHAPTPLRQRPLQF